MSAANGASRSCTTTTKAQETSMASIALDLDSILCGTSIDIDGRSYRVVHADGLTLAVYKRLERLLPTLMRSIGKSELTTLDAADTSRDLTEAVDLILRAPARVRAALTDPQRQMVVEVFSRLRRVLLPIVTEALTTRRQTGARSFRPSPIFTALTRMRSSIARRWACCVRMRRSCRGFALARRCSLQSASALVQAPCPVASSNEFDPCGSATNQVRGRSPQQHRASSPA